MHIFGTTPHGVVVVFSCIRNQGKDVRLLVCFGLSRFRIISYELSKIERFYWCVRWGFKGLRFCGNRFDKALSQFFPLCWTDALFRWKTETLCCDCDAGKVELGERMALQVFAETEPTEPSGEGVQAAIDGWIRDWHAQDIIVRRAEKDLHSIASLARANLENKESAESQV